jgi:hypothetical protein
MKVRNWEKFQHFKDRKPPWIKLYREILDDMQWHELSGDDAKVLVMIWLIASEDFGNLPDKKTLAFRLRITVKQLEASVSKLDHWLVSERYQSDITMSQINSVAEVSDHQETETETETETDIGFASFWSAYPNKKAKPAAAKAFKSAKINGHLPEVLADIESKSQSESWLKNGGQFVPMPATYLNQRRWEDGATTAQQNPSLAGCV